MTTPVDISKLEGSQYVPNLDALFSSWGLYSPVEGWIAADSDIGRWLARLVWIGGTVELYCPHCGEHSIFQRPFTQGIGQQVINNHHPYPIEKHLFYDIPVDFTCVKNSLHTARIFLQVERGDILTKIGQYPSIADLAEPELEIYRKVLGESRTRELMRGVGLSSHGVGAGSLIYLRRTMEFIVGEAEAQHKQKHGALPYDPNKERMEDKIKALHEYLPVFILENRKIYGLMSDGLHNRSEEECHALFSPCLEGIKIALDELEAARAKIDRVAAARLALQKATPKIERMERTPSEEPKPPQGES